MKKSEARALVALLAAAFPRDWVAELTEEVYVGRLERLDHFEAAQEAVELAIDNAERLPSIAAIRSTYGRVMERHRPSELPEAALTDEQREENIRRARAFTEELAARLQPPAPPKARYSRTANAELEDGPGEGTGLIVDGDRPLIRVYLHDPERLRAYAALPAGEAGEPPQKRVAVYERTDRTSMGMKFYRFLQWEPDEQEEPE